MDNPEFKGDIKLSDIELGSSKSSDINQENIGTSKTDVASLATDDKNQNLTSGAHGTRVTHPTSYLETMMHLFKGNVGSGIYAMGDAFKNAGLIFGTVVTVVLGIISVHCQHILLSQSEKLQTEQKLAIPPDFATTIELTFKTGPVRLRKFAVFMRRLVNIFLCITQLGFCCVYFVFISTNLKKILDHFEKVFDIHFHTLIALLPILLACLIRNIKFITPLSAIANVLMVVGLSITIYFACINLPPVSTRSYIADWNRIPLFFGTTIYAFEGIGLVLPLKNEMANPKHFQKPLGVLNTGMVVVIILITTVGFLGFLQWGEAVEGSLTLNLPQDNIFGIMVQAALVLSIGLTFPIQFYVPAEIIWGQLQNRFGPFTSPTTCELILRSALVLLTFALAEVIPHLGLFISLVGAVSSSALALIFPPLIELVSLHTDGKIPFYVWLKNGLILLLGFVGLFTGAYESLRSLKEAFGF